MAAERRIEINGAQRIGAGGLASRPLTRGHDPAVVTFLARLDAEQTRYLDAVDAARRPLDDDPGDGRELAPLAALHGRLTRELLDAQRAIIRHRADVVAHAATVVAQADHEAAAIVDAARLRSATPASLPGAAPDALDAPGRDRHRGPVDEAEAYVRMVDLALEIEATVDALTHDRLRTLLDDWWSIEQAEADAIVDDANAQAAMRLHLARAEAQAIAPDPVAAPAPAALLPALPAPRVTRPAGVAETLDDAGIARLTHADLDAVLASLLDEFAEPAAEVGAAPNVGSSAASLPPAAQPTRGEVAEQRRDQEAFNRFWGSGHSAAHLHGYWSPIGQRLAPVLAFAVALAALLAWIG